MTTYTFVIRVEKDEVYLTRRRLLVSPWQIPVPKGDRTVVSPHPVIPSCTAVNTLPLHLGPWIPHILASAFIALVVGDGRTGVRDWDPGL